MNKILGSAIALSIAASMSPLSADAASYRVVDKETNSKYKFSYSQEINNSGLLALSLTDEFNININYDRLTEADFDAVALLAENELSRDVSRFPFLKAIEDLDALKAGNPTANDLGWLVLYIDDRNNGEFATYQVFGSSVSYLDSTDGIKEIVPFDEFDSDLNSLSRTTSTVIHGVNHNGLVYGDGDAPTKKLEFTNASDSQLTYWLKEFDKRAFVSVDGGNTFKTVLAPAADHGGFSSVVDVNEDNVAVGFASVAYNDTVKEFIENDTEDSNGCLDPNRLVNQPFEVCLASNRSNLYQINAVKWELDSQGNVIDSLGLGTLITPSEEDDRLYASQAYAINQSGTIVGVSSGLVLSDYPDDRETNTIFTSNYAFVYKNGEMLDITDRDEYRGSALVDVNDSDIAVGYFTKVINGTTRKKLAYVDTSADEMVPVLPQDFFLGSDSIGRAINANNIIVGDGEIESQNGSLRRREAFMFDINSQEFTNLNSLLACNSAYTIVEARGINDNNHISATAVIDVPRRDAKGEIMLDDDGNQMMESVARAVVLEPTGGEIEDCSVEEEKIQREGASIFYLFSLLLLSLGFRRK